MEPLNLRCPHCQQTTLEFTSTHGPEQFFPGTPTDPTVIHMDIQQRCSCKISEPEMQAVMNGVMLGFMHEHERFHEEEERRAR